MKARIILLVVFVVIVFGVISSMGRVYFLQSDEVSEVVFNDKGCVVFIRQTDFGWSLSHLEYVGRVAGGLLGGANPANGRRSRLRVIGIADQRVSELLLSDEYNFAGVDQGSVYISNQATLWRWRGEDFERVEPASETLPVWPSPDPSGSSAFQGWNKRYLTSAHEQGCGTGTISVRQSNGIRRIELKRDGVTKELFSLNTQWKRVDRDAFLEAMKSR